jgi:hypothetical protein
VESGGVSQIVEVERFFSQVTNQDYKDPEQPLLRLDLRVCEARAAEDGNVDESLRVAFPNVSQSRSSGFW